MASTGETSTLAQTLEGIEVNSSFSIGIWGIKIQRKAGERGVPS